MLVVTLLGTEKCTAKQTYANRLLYKIGNQMAFGYKTFYSGRYSNGPDHTISNLLNTKQVKVCYSDPTVSNL